MSDPLRADRDEKPPHGSPAATASFLRRLAGQILDPGAESPVPNPETSIPVRLDGPHSVSVSRSEPTVARRQTGDQPVRPETPSGGKRDFEAARTSGQPRFAGQEEEVLRETGQIAAHLRDERKELERREHLLHEQHAQLDKEWRSARLWVHEFEEEMLKRQADCKVREEELNQKISACETLVSELEEQERLVLGLRDQMSSERADLRAMVDRELEVERLALKQTRQALDEERQALAQESEKRRREQEESVRAANAKLEAERALLRTQLVAQLDAERAEFERERAEWNARQTAEEQALGNRRGIAESAAQRAQEELHSIHQRELDELRRTGEAQESQLAAERKTIEEERQQLAAERQRFSDELAELRKSQTDEMERERLRVREEIENSRRELDAVRSRIEDDLKRRVEEREQNLREEQKKLEEQHREQLSRLEQERGLLENRVRFQQDHLQKARKEVEAAQQELRRQHQADRTELEQREAALRLRQEQLAHVRALLDEREESLAREHALIAEKRSIAESQCQKERDALAKERAAWESDRDAREKDLRNREATLAADAQRLESRRVRLDALRTELEETHRSTLEMRLAIEEVWSQLSQHAGTEAAKRRLADTQQLLQDDWRQARESLAAQRRELGELEAAIRERRAELEREKKEAAEAAHARQTALERHRKQLAEETAALHVREQELNELRERWANEKIEVEQIIRGLLAQLAQKAEEPAGDEARPAA
jgi:hypothetical protein